MRQTLAGHLDLDVDRLGDEDEVHARGGGRIARGPFLVPDVEVVRPAELGSWVAWVERVREGGGAGLPGRCKHFVSHRYPARPQASQAPDFSSLVMVGIWSLSATDPAKSLIASSCSPTRPPETRVGGLTVPNTKRAK